MKYRMLGRSSLNVSEVCLGTMTWGIQNSQLDADRQLSMAIEHGVNFIDTAEMYPVPPRQDTYGDTERILGDWLARHRVMRSDLIIMTKIAGSGLHYIRNGRGLNAEDIPIAIDNSLARLQTDYIDVYQLHWPNRVSPHFGRHWIDNFPLQRNEPAKEIENMRAVLSSIHLAIKAGKIRYWGLSDETPWGINTYLRLCDEIGMPKPVSIQNEFSLLHLKDWPYLIEVCINEEIAYLPWSPLATGMLTGKYLNGNRPKGSRWTLVQRNGLFRDTEQSHLATQAYVDLARRHHLTPAELALGWCKDIPGVTSTIIGATNVQQLRENIEAFRIALSTQINSEIGMIMREFPLPF